MIEQGASVKEEISPLRSEIVESEKARMDFLKWKLIAVAALGAIGLGFSKQDGYPLIASAYVLCIIPFVCAYVDLLCYHNDIRILVIGKFLSHTGDPYEKYVEALGDTWKQKGSEQKEKGVEYFFEIENFVLFYSSVFLSLLIGVLGIIIWRFVILFLIVGLSGIGLQIYIRKYYKKRREALENISLKNTLKQKQ